MVHFMRNVLSDVPRKRSAEVAAKLKAIFAHEDREACLRKRPQKNLCKRQKKTV